MSRMLLVIALGAAVLGAGCSQVSKIATQVGVSEGAITQEEADSINRSVVAMEKAWTDITPEQEHYIGRAVAATLLASYPALDDAGANAYLNRLGQTLALASDRPETFGGYHFLLLDSDEINAFACPGGLVLVTRGLVACCDSEDALAAVLAHEIGHVAGKHGLRAIKASRLTSALTIVAAEGARNLGGEDLARLSDDLEGTIGDITQTLVNNGYSRDLERAADTAAVAVLGRVGYNPRGLESMLDRMQARWKPSGPGFMQTHPSPRDRLADVSASLKGFAPLEASTVRQARFAAALDGI
ncbi:MAG TPA: M48 family metalloprotease [Candidatus Krumholzibacteria bacterium]|nr:M48 family metalloprotease [Candidatus Krumholzibacteria bacterium]HPD71867.1 M48 family metalloprotease [Candidatus Krumholzibacteria bacterium]HRY41200.1 M48 family metalloprotease [Candidatus Krumholzibacteria bacterium]